MVAGIGILVYVGVSYERSKQTPPTPHWSAAEAAKGRRLAAALASQQRITLPQGLQKGRQTRPGQHTQRRLVAPGTETATRVVIPKIAVDAPVVETPPQDGVWPVPDWAVGHLTTTPNPGAAGNDALSAHDDIKGELFKRIGELRPGDIVQLYTQHAVYTYVVTSQQTVDPYDTSVLDSTQQATVTLISCTPYWVDTQRIVVQAVLKSQAAA
jgi:sortase A